MGGGCREGWGRWWLWAGWWGWCWFRDDVLTGERGHLPVHICFLCDVMFVGLFIALDALYTPLVYLSVFYLSSYMTSQRLNLILKYPVSPPYNHKSRRLPTIINLPSTHNYRTKTQHITLAIKKDVSTPHSVKPIHPLHHRVHKMHSYNPLKNHRKNYI